MKKILVVESTQPIEGLSSSLFRRRECVLQVASSAAEGLSQAEKERPDLVILDTLVDDFSAEDFVQALQSADHGTELPVLLVVPDASVADEGRLLRSGAAAVMSRSVDEIDLNVKVCELLGISLRRHVRTFVKMKVETTVGATTRFATISNISLGGVGLETEQKLPVGDFIKLQFFLPGDDEALTVIGRIVRGNATEGGRSYGCSFLDLTDAGRRRIHDFVTAAEGDEA